MSEPKSEYYEDGAAAARRTGKYATPDADVRCPHEVETPEADEWYRGYEDAKKAME